MKRDLFGKLVDWKGRDTRLPLIVSGARQVGKTFILKEFGARQYESCAYVNFMSDESKAILESGYDARRALSNISIITKTDIKPGETLVILDEIQEAPSMLALLKAFAEELPNYHIAAAGSYLGVALRSGASFPVGKVEMLDMHPLTFVEFADAMGEQGLADAVRAIDFQTMTAFSSRLQRLLRQYYFVGGMPAAVLAFIDDGESYDSARRVQTNLLRQYDSDFSKHPARNEVERIRLAFDSIPAHLGRENHKFMFGHIERGARARQYETAIQWIVDSGLAVRVHRVDKIATPLKFYRDLSAFKLYLHDVGLLGAAMDVEAADVILSDKALTEYKGALTEQYVCQQLVAAGKKPYYWSSSGTAEVDFVIQKSGTAVPIEVKAAENLNSKSLRVAHDKTGLNCVRTSMSDYREQDWLTNIPLWAVGSFFAQ